MTSRTSPGHTSLFDRLGGFDAVETAVGRLFERLRAETDFAALGPGGKNPDTRWHVAMLLADIFGGPMVYDGPEPREIAELLGLDAAKVARLIDLVAASFAGAAAGRSGLAAEIQTRLGEFSVLKGYPPAGSSPPAEPAARPTGAVTGASAPPTPLALSGLVAEAEHVAVDAGLADWNLFVLDPHLTVVYASAAAARAAAICEADLRRSFNLGAGLSGTSMLKFHSAPSQLQAILSDPARLPHETTWSFGQAVWTARIHALRGADRGRLGYAVLWRDESAAHHAQAAFQRLRNQVEDLPVPVMFPDPTREKWFGNAACEHALQRLAAHLPLPVNPLDGVPIAIFFPDAQRRRALFSEPERLPHKEQVKIGPQTIAILVTPVRDESQRYLGPQITWEIVHYTRPESDEVGAPEPATPEPARFPPAPATIEPPVGSAASALRGEARELASSAEELQRLVRLLESAADQAEGQVHFSGVDGDGHLPEAARLAESAIAALRTAEEAPQAAGRREAVQHALETITGFARRTNQLALDAALLAVQDDVSQAAAELRAEARALAQELRDRVRSLEVRTQGSAELLRQSMMTAARLAELKAELGAGTAGT